MEVRVDPEENEIHALRTLAGGLAGQRVLEIGCGDGRLTWRYAAAAGHVIAIDPNPDKLASARRDCPTSLRERVEFLNLGLEDYAAGAHTDAFDLAILAWSL
jgi:ubiquinone/menaquinone biosynthesis C-methylase UbiE